LNNDESRPQGGWYARQRDEARATTTLAVRSKSAREPLGPRALDTSHEALPEAIQAARPQPLSEPTQTILEWSRPPQKSTLPQGTTILR
jgi:hypothetical protein